MNNFKKLTGTPLRCRIEYPAVTCISTAPTTLESAVVEKRPDRTGMTQKNRLPPEKKFEYAKKSDFAGKKQIGAFEVVCWVAENMALDDVGVSDCPSSTAWGMLQQCRTNPMYRFEFWKTIYPKLLPSRAQIEDGSDQGGFDGEVTHEHLRKLAEMRDNAIGEVVGE